MLWQFCSFLSPRHLHWNPESQTWLSSSLLWPESSPPPQAEVPSPVLLIFPLKVFIIALFVSINGTNIHYIIHFKDISQSSFLLLSPYPLQSQIKAIGKPACTRAHLPATAPVPAVITTSHPCPFQCHFIICQSNPTA